MKGRGLIGCGMLIRVRRNVIDGPIRFRGHAVEFHATGANMYIAAGFYSIGADILQQGSTPQVQTYCSRVLLHIAARFYFTGGDILQQGSTQRWAKLL